jgi:hypothetical protein
MALQPQRHLPRQRQKPRHKQPNHRLRQKRLCPLPPQAKLHPSLLSNLLPTPQPNRQSRLELASNRLLVRHQRCLSHPAR